MIGIYIILEEPYRTNKYIGGDNVKKSLILVALLALLMVVVLAFWGCGTPAEEVVDPDHEDDNGTEVIDEPAEDIELPEGVPVYPGATFISHSEGELEDEEVYVFQTPDSPEDVAAFYVSTFEAEGYEDFFYMADSEMAEVQVQRNGHLVTVTADAVNGTTNIELRIRPFE